MLDLSSRRIGNVGIEVVLEYSFLNLESIDLSKNLIL